MASVSRAIYTSVASESRNQDSQLPTVKTEEPDSLIASCSALVKVDDLSKKSFSSPDLSRDLSEDEEKEKWSEEASDQLAKTGGRFKLIENAKDWNNRSSIYVDELDSCQRGFGKAFTRYVFKKSQLKGFGGNVHKIAAWSSHIFHLKMGMLPSLTKYNFSEVFWYNNRSYKVDSERILKELPELQQIIKERQKSKAGNLRFRGEKSRITLLQSMLSEVLRLKTGSSPKKISYEMILQAQRKDFNVLEKHKVTVINFKDIENLLIVLEEYAEKHQGKNPLDDPEINTKRMGIVPMMLSDEGIERWARAVDSEHPTDFKSFTNLEHLDKYLPPATLIRLNKIRAIPRKGLSK